MNPSGNYWRTRAQRTGRRLKHLAFSRLYQDRHRNLDRTVFVAGMARSGTTWLGDIIASQNANRLMFEPFNPWPIGILRSPHYIQYKRPDDEDAELAEFCNRLFRGEIRHGWIDRQIDHLLPEGRVVKAVRANLMLGWLRRNFPEVPQVLIIRHPCAVVSSWLQLGWMAEQDITAFFEQPDLIDDFLANRWDLVQETNTVEERIAIAWCINYLVPLQHPQTGGLHIVLYEHLITQPEIEIPLLVQSIGMETEDAIYDHLQKPSTTSKQDSATMTGEDRLNNWRYQLSPDQVERVLRVVVNFGLDYLYSDASTPISQPHL